MDDVGPIQLVVVQSTPFCNLDCRYCYLPQRSDRRRMTAATIDAIGRNVLGSRLLAEETTLVWHAGEPLVLPPDWYAEAFTKLSRHIPADKRLRHAFQTNGMFIDDRWVELFRAWDVIVGVSLDGPRHLHDRNRVTRHGKGTFDAVLAGIRRLQQQDYPFHVISVLSREALDDPDQMVDFYLEHGITDVCFNIEELEGVNTTSSLAGYDAKAAYTAFLRRVVARLRTARPGFRCREIDGFAGRVAASPDERRRNHQTTPLAMVTIDVRGGLSTFSPELLGASAPDFGGFVFADVHEAGSEAILQNPSFRRLHRLIREGVERCRSSCRYFDVCGGGAPGNKFFEHGDFAATETLYCRLTTQAVVDALLPEFEADLRDIRHAEAGHVHP